VQDNFVMGRYYLPEDAAIRRDTESRLASLFVRQGFREIIPPVLLGLAAPGRDWGAVGGVGCGDPGVSYAVLTRDGALMTLRSDFTAPVAAIAARHLLSEGEAAHVFYSGSVFRAQKPGSGRHEEWRQVGAEIIGEGEEADADLLALAAESLLELGLRDFSIGIGHAGLLSEVLDRIMVGAAPAPARAQRRAAIWTALAARDFVSFNQLTADLDPASIAALRGEAEAGPLADLPQAKAMTGIMQALRDRGLGDYFRFDLTIAREMHYYTGIVFEGYARGSGNAVIGGGRYDSLLEGFGVSAPAAGFAIDVDSAVSAMGGVRLWETLS
jgi:ATP phosphoribosyltransferase regulatory subunit